MVVQLTMTARTWAALDAALSFFRAAPAEIEPGQRLSRHCRLVHKRLRQAGLRADYVRIGCVAPGRALMRLHVRGQVGAKDRLEIELPRRVARSLASACLTIIEVQTDCELGQLLDHEAEELQAARTFLSELRRQGVPGLIPARRGRGLIIWDEARQEYSFTAHVAWRVREHYLRVGASPN